MPDRKPPVAAQRKPVSATLHGIARQDEYAWFKDPDWQRVMRDPDVLDPEIRAYLEAENEYKDAFLAPHADLRAALYDEMRGRIEEDDSTVPAPDGGWLYYVRLRRGRRTPGPLPRAVRSRSGRPKRCCSTATGRRKARAISASPPAGTAPTTAVSPIRHRRERLGALPDLRARHRIGGDRRRPGRRTRRGDVVWANDGETVFYTVIDDNHRPWQVRRHRIGDRRRGRGRLRGIRSGFLRRDREVGERAVRHRLRARSHHVRGPADRRRRAGKRSVPRRAARSRASSTTSPTAETGCSSGPTPTERSTSRS